MKWLINGCGWCGNELPPYNIWKWCLCPSCDAEVKNE